MNSLTKVPLHGGRPEPRVKHQLLPLICFRTGDTSLCISVPAGERPSPGKNKGSINLQRTNCVQCRAFVRHTPVFTSSISSSREEKKKRRPASALNNSLGSTFPCLAPFNSHFFPQALPYLPAMPQLPRLAGQAAARLQPGAQKGTETQLLSSPLLSPTLQKLLRENQCQGGNSAARGCSVELKSASPISSRSPARKGVSVGRGRCCTDSQGML